MKPRFLFWLATAVLLSLACGLAGNLIESTPPGQPSATPASPTVAPPTAVDTQPPPTESPIPPTAEPIAEATAAPEAPAPEAPAPEAVIIADLDELYSYRLMRVTRIETASGVTTNTHTLTWVSRPLAYQYMVGDNNLVGTLWIEGRVWSRGGSEDWVEQDPSHVSQPFDLLPTNLARSYAAGMEFVALETVNEINCRRYTHDMTTGAGPGYLNVWIADQENLPPVVVRSELYMTGSMGVTVTRHNLYNVNQEMLIEPP
jgi:hypothetical protein